MRTVISIPVVLLALITLAPLRGTAQLETLWTRTYPFTTGEEWHGGGPSVQPTLDGGFIVATHCGYCRGDGEGNVLVAKTDDAGDVLWTRVYDFGPFLTTEISIQQLRDGGYVVCGGFCLFYSCGPGMVMRLDAAGDSLWTEYVDGVMTCIQQTADDGLIMSGFNFVDAGGWWPVLVKTDVDGNAEWSSWWPQMASFSHVVELRDGSGYAMVGWRRMSTEDVYFVKTDMDGIEIASRTYGDSQGDEYGSEIRETSDGGFIICGRSGDEACLIRTEASGDTLWTRTYRDLPSMLSVADITDPALPHVVGSTDARGDASDVAVAGHHAYVTTRGPDESGLHVVDISDPGAPVLVGSVDIPEEAHGVAVLGDRAYVGWGTCLSGGAGCPGGLDVVDVSRPARPEILGSVEMSGDRLARGVAVSRGYAYVATFANYNDNFGGLEVVDVSDPTSPRTVGKVDCWRGTGVDVAGDHAYLLSSYYLDVVDISAPSSPRIVGEAHAPNGYMLDLAVVGDSAYIAASTGLLVADVSDPSSPEFVASVDTPTRAEGVAVSGRYAYVATRAGLEVIDMLSEPPGIVGRAPTLGRASAVAVAGGHAYVAEGSLYSSSAALSVVERSRNRFLTVGQSFDRVWMLEVDEFGNTLWSELCDALPGAGYARRIRPVVDRGYIVAGGTSPSPGDSYSLFLMRLAEPATGVGTPVTAKSLGVHLRPNVPNPFSLATMIRFYVPEPGEVVLRIYDPMGRHIRTLLQAPRPTGTHTVSWDGTNQAGTPVAGGVYFYQISLNGESRTRRMILVR